MLLVVGVVDVPSALSIESGQAFAGAASARFQARGDVSTSSSLQVHMYEVLILSLTLFRRWRFGSWWSADPSVVQHQNIFLLAH